MLGKVRTGVLAIGLATAIHLAMPRLVAAIGDGNDLIADIPSSGLQVRLELLVDAGDYPVTAIKGSGDGSGRLFIMQSRGVIQIYENGALLPTPFLNAPASPELRAMSGLAFHPNFPTDPRFYLITGEALPNASTPHYTPSHDLHSTAFDNVVMEYEVDSLNEDIADTGTARELLRITQPYISHNINDLTFGGDGYLYLAVGDGGNTRTGTPTHYNANAQLTTVPYGKILRIDIDTIGPNGRYGIPGDNPYAGGSVPEIFAYGVRNPWRISQDRNTGDVYTAVNGDITIEWIIRVALGANYGWDSKEGSYLWNSSTGEATVDPTPDPGLTTPLAEYDHNHTTTAFGSCIGGFVYRGSDMPEHAGSYLFHDYVAAQIIAMNTTTGALTIIDVDPGGDALGLNDEITWGEDDNGELYIGRYGGEVLRVLRSIPDVYTDLAGVSNGNGTDVSPFDNLADAVEDVATGGTVHLAPGDTAETFSSTSAIMRPMTLENSEPGSGTARIGVSGARRATDGFVSND